MRSILAALFLTLTSSQAVAGQSRDLPCEGLPTDVVWSGEGSWQAPAYVPAEGRVIIEGIDAPAFELGYADGHLVSCRFSVSDDAVEVAEQLFGAPLRVSGRTSYWYGDDVSLEANSSGLEFKLHQPVERSVGLMAPPARLVTPLTTSLVDLDRQRQGPLRLDVQRTPERRAQNSKRVGAAVLVGGALATGALAAVAVTHCKQHDCSIAGPMINLPVGYYARGRR